MSHHLATCTQCGNHLDPGAVMAGGPQRCPRCGYTAHIAVFPNALTERFSPETPEPALETGESLCFFHGSAVAQEACEVCGRLLCRLCTLRLPDGVRCPTCAHQELHAGPQRTLRQQYLRHDRIALVLAFLPFCVSWCALPALFFDPRVAGGMWLGVVFTVSLLTAPLAIYAALHYWKRAESPVGNPRTRLLISLLVACPQVLAWFVGFAGLLGFLLFTAGTVE